MIGGLAVIGVSITLFMLIIHVWTRVNVALTECDRLARNNSVGFRELWDKIGEMDDAFIGVTKTISVLNGDMETVTENMVTVTTFKGVEDRIASVESAVSQLEANQERTRELVHSLASTLVVHRDAKGRYVKAVQPFNE